MTANWLRRRQWDIMYLWREAACGMEDALQWLVVRRTLMARRWLDGNIVSCQHCWRIGVRHSRRMVAVGGICSDVIICRRCMPEYSRISKKNARFSETVKSARLQAREMHRITAAMGTMFTEWETPDGPVRGYFCDLCSYRGPRHMTLREGIAHLRGHFYEDRELTSQPTDADIERSYLMDDEGYDDDSPRGWEE